VLLQGTRRHVLLVDRVSLGVSVVHSILVVVSVSFSRFASPLLLTLATLPKCLLSALTFLACKLRSLLPVLPFRFGVTVSRLVLAGIGEEGRTEVR